MSHLCPHPSETILATPMAIRLGLLTHQGWEGVWDTLWPGTLGAQLFVGARLSQRGGCCGRDLRGESEGRGILDVYLLVLSIHFCF